MEGALVLGINGSPVEDGNTGLLLKAALEGARRAGARTHQLDLNRMRIMPCQACGASPEPEFCFFWDDMNRFYDRIVEARGIIFATPVYFDSVSAQSKLFIDRCNCFRSPGYAEEPGGSGRGSRFEPLLDSSRYGAAILVGGERQDYLRPARVVRAFFKWLGIARLGEMVYSNNDFESGSVRHHRRFVKRAELLGEDMAERIERAGATERNQGRLALQTGSGGWRDVLQERMP